MNKVPDFLLCENEQNDLEGEYVLHTKAPRFLAKLVYDNPEADFVIVDEIDPLDAGIKVTLLAKMEKWYDDYQAYLDEQYGGEDE